MFLLRELQWAFQQGIVASIIKTFALQPAVGLSAWLGRVQHSEGICFATCRRPFGRAWSRAAF
eukprot:1306974-Rhodomonas_salina.1